MKKNMNVLVLALVGMILVSGCGKKNDPVPPGNQNPPTGGQPPQTGNEYTYQIMRATRILSVDQNEVMVLTSNRQSGRLALPYLGTANFDGLRRQLEAAMRSGERIDVYWSQHQQSAATLFGFSRYHNFFWFTESSQSLYVAREQSVVSARCVRNSTLQIEVSNDRGYGGYGGQDGYYNGTEIYEKVLSQPQRCMELERYFNYSPNSRVEIVYRSGYRTGYYTLMGIARDELYFDLSAF